jgi:hypothetical protein
VAHGLAAASLCLVAIGCGDDTGGDDMAMDMGMRDMTDLSGSMDDMTMPGVPSGEIVVADVVGSVWKAGPDGGVDTEVPLTHHILAANQFPMATTDHSDFSNLMTNVSTLAISGCVANYYDLTSSSAHHPTQDVDVGTLTLGAVNKGTTMTTGWDSGFRFGSPGPMAQGGLYASPLPPSVTCARDSTLGFIFCSYTGAAGTPITAGGQSPSSVVFPPMTIAEWGVACASFAGGSTACNNACDQFGHAGTCEQRLLYTALTTVDGGTGGSSIGFDVPGGAPYAGSTKSVPVNAPVYVTRILKGTTVVCSPAGTPCNGLEKLAGNIDKTQSLTIEFSCDQNDQGTTGAGCSTTDPFALVTLVGQSSTNPRSAFSQTAKYGTLSCIEQQKVVGSAVVVPAAAMAAFLDSQTGGSVNLNLVHGKGALAGISPAQLYIGGVGYSSFINLP